MVNYLFVVMLLLGVSSHGSAMQQPAGSSGGGDQKKASTSQTAGDQKKKLKDACNDPQKLVMAIHDVNKARDSNNHNHQISIKDWGLLLESVGVDVHKKDEKTGDTLLHYAARLKKASVCKILVHAAQANPMVKNNEGKTPLDLADPKTRKALIKSIKRITKEAGKEIVEGS